MVLYRRMPGPEKDMNNEMPTGKTSGIRAGQSVERACRTIYVVDNDPVLRRAMPLALERANYTVKCFSLAEALLAAVDEQTRGILILDLSLSDMPGLTLQKELKKRGIGLKTIFISDSGTIETTVQAIKEGAIDFIEKPFSDQRLLNSVAEALAVAIAEEKTRRQRSEIGERYQRLTQREREIMGFLIRGDTNRKLAERMGLSSRTVEIHRSKIMRKLQATSLPDLVRMVYTNSDFQPEDVLVDIGRSLRLPKDPVN
jgi:two-component system response regulator FixJ